jgi:hypothetical protein
MAIVQAADGMGKTALLNEIYDRYLRVTTSVLIDLQQKPDPLCLLSEIADQLIAQRVSLPSYQRPAPQSPTLQIIDAKIKNAPINVYLDNSGQQRQQADNVLLNILGDMEASPGLPRRLVLIDQCDAAEDPLWDWLISSLIPGFLWRSAAICVLAGCRDLELTRPQEQRIDRLPLQALDEQAIGEWLVAAGLPQMEAQANFIFRGTLGVPGDVYKFIVNLVRTEAP